MSSLRLQTRQLTFVRILFPFLLGIIAGMLKQLSIISYIIPLVIALIFIVLITFLNKQINQTKWKKYKGRLINVAFIALGFSCIGLHNELIDTDHFTRKEADSFIIYVDDVLVKNDGKVKFKARVINANKGDITSACSGNLSVTLETKAVVDYGTNLLIPSRYKLVDPPQNPYEFNYQSYLGFKNIHYQTYFKSNEFQILPVKPNGSIIYYAIKLRKKCEQQFIRYMDRQSSGILSAFLLGNRSELSPDIVNAFINTGTVHILSVSGLHVGIIYIVIGYMLGFLNKVKGGRFIKVILVLLFIWAYATITGFSPAVCRAAFMISIIATAEGFNRYVNTYNSIAVSLFFLLLLNPYLLTDVGFQLSYLAVLGIIYFQPRIYHCINIDNWLLNNIWIITSVSVAAQIVTFPLSIYYFHQFPNYFLIANIIIIPLASIILYGGIILLIVSPFSGLATLLGKMLSCIISFMNLILQKLSHLPYALLDNMMIDEIQLTILIVMILVLAGLIVSKNSRLKLAFGACITVLCCSFAWKSYHTSTQKEIIVFALKGKTAVGFTDDHNLYLNADSVLSDKQFGFSINPYVLHSGIKSVQYLKKESNNLHLLKHNNFIQFYNLRIGVIDPKFEPYEVNRKLKVDYLLITGKNHIDPDKLLKLFDTKVIIVDNSVPEYLAKHISKQCIETGIKVVDTHQSQAYRIPI